MSLNDDEVRAQIDGALRNVLWNASSYPVRVQSRILGSDMSGLIGRATDAVLPVLSQVPDEPREDEHALSGRCVLDGCHQHAMPGPATVPVVGEDQ